MTTKNALFEAILAEPDDDAPRLVYSDWLEEHGDHERAEFIRVQCRLANLSPADPDWIDLTERESDLAACLKARQMELEPPSPERFYFGLYMVGQFEEPFRRGFPYFHGCQMTGAEWTPEATARVASDLTRLVQTTTVRGLHVYSIPTDRFADLLA